MRTADIEQIKHLTISELFFLLHITNVNEIEHPDAKILFKLTAVNF